MGIYMFLDQNCPKLELSTFITQEILIEHEHEDMKWIFEQRTNHNNSFNEFSITPGDKFENKLTQRFQVAIHFHPGHLLPKTFMFTLRALVEEF